MLILKKLFFPSLIFLLCIFIAFKNYTPNTWLSGWDNLHPEFDFTLNIERSLSATWQEYQGVGVLGGMGHAAALSRELILWTFSTFIPTSFIRYLWTFLMLFIGPLGVYFLIKNQTSSKIASFVGAIFYIFNLATVQTFFTPFETFVSFYGFLPWLLFFGINYLKYGKSKNLFIFFVVSFLATSAFYVQTLFVVFAIFLAAFSVESVLKYKKDGILRCIKLAFVTLIINSFWLLPVIYFTVTSGSIPGNSHINSIATPETKIMNQARGNWQDIASLQGFWFDYYDWDQSGHYDYLYKDWTLHLSSPYVKDVSLILFAVSIAGLLLSRKPSWLILFGISYIMLAGMNPPTGKIFTFISDKIPLFTEIFRNSFTKWGCAMALVYSVGLGYLIALFRKNIFAFLVAVLIIISSIFVTFPIFQGKLISSSMRVSIPQEYFQVFDFFKNQDQTKRIANFPMVNFWGWSFYKWGYRGSGFLWYGIRQPILDRAFDVWSPNNEAFYNEVAFALSYANTDETLQKVLDKYQVSYLIFDENLYDPANLESVNLIARQKHIIDSSQRFTKIKNFGNINIYEFNLTNKPKGFVSAPQTSLSNSEFPKTPAGTPTIVETFPINQGYPEAKNCDLKNQGVVEKKKLAFGNYYAAQGGGVSCDYFYYPLLKYPQNYLMRIKGVNTAGRSVKIYLFNVASKNIDLEELLPKGNFDKYFFVSAKNISSKEGYTLNVETRSFGSVGSENEIEKIEFYPVDANPSLVQVNALENNLLIENVRKYGTWGYKLDVQNGGLLQLGQGYNNGWLGFVKVGRGWSKLEHTKVNSWANGFLVKADQFQPTQTIYLVYWPQILEWGGGILGTITFATLILTSRRRKLY